MSGRETGRFAAGPLDRARPPGPGPLRAFHFPAVHRRVLSNGMRVAVATRRDFPVVSFSLIFEAGAVREDPGLGGLSSLAAGLLDAGAGGRSAAELAESIERLGVQIDAAASWDTAHVSLTGLRSRLEPASHLLEDLTRRPDFPPHEVDRLRAERLGEILQRRANPGALATEAAARFIYAPGVPYARPLGGTPASVERITRSDLQAFHASHFLPGNAAAVVVGDVSVEKAVELLEARFGDWAGTVAPANLPAVRSRARERRLVIVDRPGSVQSEIRVGHLGVARSTGDYFALLVLNAILGGMFSSRLNLNLRERHGFTYGVSSGFSMRRQPGSFLVATAVQTEVTAAAVREVLTEIDAIREAPVRPGELEDARNYLAGVFPLRLETTQGIAARIAELTIYGLADDYFDTYRDHVLAVTLEEVQQAALRHLRSDELVTVITGDSERIQEPLAALEIGPLQIVGSAELDGLE